MNSATGRDGERSRPHKYEPETSECGVPGPASDQGEEVGDNSRGENERRFELQEPQFEWAEGRRNRQNRSIAFFAGRNGLLWFCSTILQKPFSDFGSSLQMTQQSQSLATATSHFKRSEMKTPPRNLGGVFQFSATLGNGPEINSCGSRTRESSD